MPGLNLGVGGRAAGRARYTPDPPPRSATQAAYGTAGQQKPESTVSVLSPGRSFGLAFWVQVGAVVLLVVIRQSLPKGGTK